MNDTGPPPDASRGTWSDRFQALLEVLLLSGFISGFLAMIPFSLRGGINGPDLKDPQALNGFIMLEALIALLLVMLILKMHGQTMESLGLRRERSVPHVLVGLGLVPILFLASVAVSEAFRVHLPRYYMDRNPLVDTIRTPRDLTLFLISALFAGGIKEEVQRAFILVRFQRHLGGATLGLVLWSIVFGAGHYIQGLQGAIIAGLFGLMFGITYLVRRNLIAPIVAHAAYDTAALLGYWIITKSR